MLDAIFGAKYYRNEIVWKRTSSHNDAAQGLSRYGKNHDVILFYTKADGPTWNQQFVPYEDEYIKSHYGQTDASSGKRFTTSDLTAAKPGGETSYEWHGATPPHPAKRKRQKSRDLSPRHSPGMASFRQARHAPQENP